MIKNQAANNSEQQFVLTKINTPCPSIPVIVTFTHNSYPQNVQPTLSPQTGGIVPTFNFDQCWYTPSFILPFEQSFYRSNLNYQRAKFEERIQNVSQKNISELTQIISPSSRFCQVCQLSYQCYVEHINQMNHQTKLHNSIGDCLINELVANFTSKKNKCKKIVKPFSKNTIAAKQNTIFKHTRLRQKLKHEVDKHEGVTKNNNLSTNLIGQII